MIVRAPAVACFLVPVAAMLAACNDDGGGGQVDTGRAGAARYSAPVPAPAVAQEMQAMSTDGFAGAADASIPDQAADPGAPEGMLLAYSYAVGIELPVRNVVILKDRHEAECRAAGPRLCLVLGGSVSGDGQEYAYANLSIRAAPQWLEQFRAGLSGDASDAGGRVADSSVSTEDLTRNIVDTEARLTAQETLRDRLLALLERPTDEIGDLLAVERELARVQGQIDSGRSQLAVMRARVDMSRLDLNYRSQTRAVSVGALEPVVDALRNFLRVLSGSLAWVITIVAAAIPFVLILIPLILLVVRFFRRRRGKRVKPQTAESP